MSAGKELALCGQAAESVLQKLVNHGDVSADWGTSKATLAVAMEATREDARQPLVAAIKKVRAEFRALDLDNKSTCTALVALNDKFNALLFDAGVTQLALDTLRAEHEKLKAEVVQMLVDEGAHCPRDDADYEPESCPDCQRQQRFEELVKS